MSTPRAFAAFDVVQGQLQQQAVDRPGRDVSVTERFAFGKPARHGVKQISGVICEILVGQVAGFGDAADERQAFVSSHPFPGGSARFFCHFGFPAPLKTKGLRL